MLNPCVFLCPLSTRPSARARMAVSHEPACGKRGNSRTGPRSRRHRDMAVQLATLAGTEIVRTFGGIFTVRYKTGDAGKLSARDPVSEVDRHVEKLIRTRLGERFPTHDIIGEEMEERPGRGQDCVWAVDPIDGTTNFVNGFPMFAASIGALHRGVPVAGAVWCSVSHALRAGVYHAPIGRKLRFEGNDVTPKVNADVLRRLAGVPVAAHAYEAGWETRKTGSAALECALVAAGLLERAFPHRISGTWPRGSLWCRQAGASCASMTECVGYRCNVSRLLQAKNPTCVPGDGRSSSEPGRA